MKYWLFKSEPDEYSIDDLASEKKATGRWDGIRNYQARNILRDQVSRGDQVLFYHSSCAVPGVAGTAEVVKAAYPDPSQFDASSDYYDAGATPENPKWFCVDVKFKRKFNHAPSLKQIKAEPGLAHMVLLKQGRLSVQPVSAAEWKLIMKLAERT